MANKGQLSCPFYLCYGRFLVLRLIFAAGWTATPFCRGGSGCHPKWGPATPLSPAARKPFQDDNSFVQLLSFLAQLCQHFINVHSFYTPKSDSVNAGELGRCSEFGTGRAFRQSVHAVCNSFSRAISSGLF
jgi:hypothetical protein